jgi:hypothetical protein
MRKAMSITLVLVFALVGAAAAKSVDQAGTLEKLQYMDLSGSAKDFAGTSNAGVFSAAVAGTTYYGGTVCAADSLRWEALSNNSWSFQTGVGSSIVPGGGSTYPGVDPNKAVGLHQTMQGWVGFDNTYSELTYFRRLSTASTACVGAGAGLAGSWSYYAGVLAAEADVLCYSAGVGYGNAWHICVGKTFAWAGGAVTLGFKFANDSEPGFDFTNVICDTSGGANEDVVITSYDGPVSGTASLSLTPGIELPVAGPHAIVIKFCADSDGAYSDQDGLYDTSCGEFAVDDISVSGGATQAPNPSTFESGDGGWLLLPAAAGAGGEWSNLVPESLLPAKLTPCTCTTADTVLVFEDLGVSGHGEFQDNLACSPWIDLGPTGFNNQAPGKFINYSIYAELPLLNYIFAQFNTQWYPQVCLSTGKLITSPWTGDGFVYYFGGVPQCTTAASAVDGRNVNEVSSIIPNGAEQVRIAVGMLSYCRFFGNCTGATNYTPTFDNIRLGVYGNPLAPYISTSTIQVPQDAFPENGGLSGTAPGRLDAGLVKGATSPEIGSSLGDTLIVTGGTGGAEVWVDFAVDPGPGINPGNFTAWRNSHVSRGTHDGQAWYSARMDSAEQGSSGPVSGRWMTSYHESDANFAGTDRTTDPTDLDPKGGQSRLANDIFPDDLFTPGTHISLFYRTKYTASADVPANWFTVPDTIIGAPPIEWECLPSSAAPDGFGGYEWNCVLYVDHFDGRGAQEYIEPALNSALGGTSGNFEGTSWDRWDVRAPSSQQCSYGRPLTSEYGANIVQTLGYTDIVWNSGNLAAFNLTKEDGDVLLPWLTLPDFPNNDIYFSGDGIVTSPIAEGASEPSARRIIQDLAGLNLRCATYRLSTCPVGGAGTDLTACVEMLAAGGAPVAGVRGVIHTGQGNGCPQLRSFDVISLGTPDRGTNAGDENYKGTKAVAGGLVSYASSATDAGGVDGLNYRIVVDGVSLHYRRGADGACDFLLGTTAVVNQRMSEVATYLGLSASACDDVAAGSGIPIGDRQPKFRTTLANFAPNPLLAGATGRIQFTMARDSKAKVDIFDVEGRLVKTVFDGIAQEGINEAFWNGSDATGNQVANGVYFYRLRANTEDFSKKMVVVRNGGN